MSLDGTVQETADGGFVVDSIVRSTDRFEKQNAMGWHTFLDILTDTLASRKVRTRQEYMVRNAARYGVDLNNLQR
jgi:hypothetical protein